MNAKRLSYLPSVDASSRRFPNALRIGETVYASSEPIDNAIRSGSPDIQDQTHEAFSAFVALLEDVGARMADLVKLHTFYVFDGEADATAYWERMTHVRLQYFANPGPAGTALRVKGAPIRKRLIAIDGVASLAPGRQRIMPAHAWNWSMPTPLSQGWRVGPVVYAGGQISADRLGKTVAPDDVTQQTINTMDFLHHVLHDAGAGFEDIVSLKIAYQHHGNETVARAVLDEILGVVRPLVAPMAVAAAEKQHGSLDEEMTEEVKAMAAATDNVGLFFGEDIFVAIASILLIQGSMASFGIQLTPFQLSVWAIPSAICAFIIHGARLLLLDRELGRRR